MTIINGILILNTLMVLPRFDESPAPEDLSDINIPLSQVSGFHQ